MDIWTSTQTQPGRQMVAALVAAKRQSMMLVLPLTMCFQVNVQTISSNVPVVAVSEVPGNVTVIMTVEIILTKLTVRTPPSQLPPPRRVR